LNTPLWVDTTCINQSDNDEKTAQVRRMDEMFSKAKGFIIWLGEEQSTDMKGLELMHRLYHAAFEQQLVDFKLVPSSQHPRFGLPVVEDPIWTAVWAIFRHPWFQRMWIVKNFSWQKSLCFALAIIDPTLHNLLPGDLIQKSPTSKCCIHRAFQP